MKVDWHEVYDWAVFIVWTLATMGAAVLAVHHIFEWVKEAL